MVGLVVAGFGPMIGSLLMTLLPPERRDTTAPRFDEPGAAARSDLARRQPTDGRLDMPGSYEAATRHVASLARFSSAINRDLPTAQPAARVWVSGSGRRTSRLPFFCSSTSLGLTPALASDALTRVRNASSRLASCAAAGAELMAPNITAGRRGCQVLCDIKR